RRDKGAGQREKGACQRDKWVCQREKWAGRRDKWAGQREKWACRREKWACQRDKWACRRDKWAGRREKWAGRRSKSTWRRYQLTYGQTRWVCPVEKWIFSCANLVRRCSKRACHKAYFPRVRVKLAPPMASTVQSCPPMNTLPPEGTNFCTPSSRVVELNFWRGWASKPWRRRMRSLRWCLLLPFALLNGCVTAAIAIPAIGLTAAVAGGVARLVAAGRADAEPSLEFHPLPGAPLMAPHAPGAVDFYDDPPERSVEIGYIPMHGFQFHSRRAMPAVARLAGQNGCDALTEFVGTKVGEAKDGATTFAICWVYRSHLPRPAAAPLPGSAPSSTYR
ncbi:MAG: hypothetical protein ACYCWW_06020, partial [Deltaproteobacteria bacterium]